MIFRLRDNEPEKTIGLWVDLAYLYQRKLGQPDNARVALEVAAKLSPTDPRVQAAIYAVGSEEPGAPKVEVAREAEAAWQQVAEGHRQRLARAPDDPAPLHDLVELHREGQRPDEALTAATVLVHLGVATEQERALERELAPRSLVRASSPISPTMLDQVRHSDDLPVVEQLMGLLSPVLSSVFPVGADRLGSDDGRRIEGSAGEALDDLLAYVSQQLGIDLPPLYWSDTLGAELAPLPAAELRLLVGTALLQPPSPSQAAFSAARALSCIGEGRRHIYGRRGAELKCALLSTLTLCREGFKVPDPAGEVAAFRQGIEASGLSVESLRKLIDRLLEQDKRIDLSQWMRAVRCTSARIGLLVCADLGAALRALHDDEATTRDLIDFALSGLYADLRQELGISVDV